MSQILNLTSISSTTYIKGDDFDQVILTCDDGPCNKDNLKGFECSYLKYDNNYKFICVSDNNKFFNYYFKKKPITNFLIIIGLASSIIIIIKLINKLVHLCFLKTKNKYV